VFCEGVQHRLRFCLDHLNCVKMTAFQFYFRSGKQRKVGWMGTTMLFWSKISWGKRKCETVRCRDATASSFVARGEVFEHFHRLAVKHHSSMRNRLFGLPGRILYEHWTWCQRKWWASSWLFFFTSLAFFGLGEFGFPCTAHAFFPERLSNHRQGLRYTFSEICTKFCAVPLSDPSRNRIRPDTRLQLTEVKNQHFHLATWNFVQTPKIC
jgi:hypothetical protein